MWTTFADYRLVHAGHELWVAPAGPRRPDYAPTALTGLPEALAEVHRAWGNTVRMPSTFDETSPVVRALFVFLRAYGHLGQTALAGRAQKATETGLMMFEGDSLLWVLDHAANVHEILALTGGLQHRRTKALERYLVRSQQRSDQLAAWWRRTSDAPPLPPLTVPTIAPPTWSAELPAVEQPLREALSETATIRRRAALEQIGHQLLSARLTPNLPGVDRVYDSRRGVVPLQFRALIQLIYHQLADRIDAATIRQCACGAWFFSTDPRQRYCAPPPGVPESRCATRFRMRRYERRRPGR